MHKVTAVLHVCEEGRRSEPWERTFDMDRTPEYGMAVRLWQDGPAWPMQRHPSVTVEHDGTMSVRVELVRMEVRPPGSVEPVWLEFGEGGTVDRPAPFRTFNDDGTLRDRLTGTGWAMSPPCRGPLLWYDALTRSMCAVCGFLFEPGKLDVAHVDTPVAQGLVE